MGATGDERGVYVSARKGDEAEPAVERPSGAGSPRRDGMDEPSRAWVAALRGGGSERDAALRQLHDLLLGAARHEVARRGVTFPHLRGGDLEDIAMQAADDATMGVLRRLDDFRGESRFTTWAYKFALLEAAVAVRRRAWQGREVPLEPEGWSAIAADARAPHEVAEGRQLWDEIDEGIREALTPHQRQVLVALAINGVPIDVLAERLGTTRGALYKTLHDARRKLRDRLGARGLLPRGRGGGTR